MIYDRLDQLKMTEQLCQLAREVLIQDHRILHRQTDVANLDLSRHLELADKIDQLELKINKTRSLATWLSILTIMTCMLAGAFGALLVKTINDRRTPVHQEKTP